MEKNKVLQMVQKVTEIKMSHDACKTAFPCHGFLHQPKRPMKSEKENNKFTEEK